MDIQTAKQIGWQLLSPQFGLFTSKTKGSNTWYKSPFEKRLKHRSK